MNGMANMRDQLDRPLRDLRVSVTDRCNFRCSYCMPRETYHPGYRFLRRDDLLSYEEIARLAGIFARLGARKLRLTGGEPLVRGRLEKLVEQLAAIDGIEDLALTTNGVLLTRDKARALKAAGLRRVTVSLDALDADVFARLADAKAAPAEVLAGIAAAADAGLPVKINAVVVKGVNDGEILPLAERFRHSGHTLRFIEYMDVGSCNRWRLGQVVSAADILRAIDQRWPLEALAPAAPGEVARRWAYRDGGGEVGVIASVSQPFCRDCVRARLSSDGKLYTCLFASRGRDLRAMLRGGHDDAAIEAQLRALWTRRHDRYSEQRAGLPAPVKKVEMSYIGG